ncbi:MAG: metalloregulator ArsR/SmtB family transcription factor [Candidatus Wallbacteria bacterium]|nr:metalloregulator ArsR/SmtB family transcription factor [Candidatus Wallbacteria bacterium]
MMDSSELLKILESLAEKNRLDVYCLLLTKGEHCVNDIQRALAIPQPAVSKALARLRKAGLLIYRKVNNSVFYNLNPDFPANRILQPLFTDENLPVQISLSIVPPAAHPAAGPVLKTETAPEESQPAKPAKKNADKDFLL